MAINSFENYFLSWKPDPDRLTRPLYLALANALESDIRDGNLVPGTRLPPQRELADFLGINFTTVTRAYDLCREKHLIYGVIGRGSFVAPLPPTDQVEPERLIELGVVNGFDQITAPVVAATRAVLSKSYLENLYNYSAPTGHPHQRNAAMRYLETLGVYTDPEHVLIFSGAQNIISTALATLFKLGDRIAVDQFTYANFLSAARMFHIQPVPIDGDRQGMLPDALERACRQNRIAGVFLMPDCANPTTVAMPPERKRAIAEIIRRYELTLIEDDIIGCMLDSDQPLPLFALLPEQTVFVGGSTKCLCSGLRVAFAAVPERFRRAMSEGLRNLNIKTSSLDAEILTELLLSGRGGEVISQKRELARRANRLFEQYFPGKIAETRPLFFRWLAAPGLPGRNLEAQLRSRGVNVLASERFQCRPEPGTGGYIRLSLASAASLGELESGLRIVHDYLAAES